jgi:hypothetical protein
MGLLIGVPILVDRRLDVGVAQLLLDEVDRLAGSEPEGCGGVAQVVEPNHRGEAGVLEGDVVATATDVVAVQHAAFGADGRFAIEAGAPQLALHYPLA